MFKILNRKEDFIWYCKELDVRGRYEYDHRGEPERYPCKVESEWGDNPNGPYYYDHTFYYQKEIICPCCQHKMLEWDVDGGD